MIYSIPVIIILSCKLCTRCHPKKPNNPPPLGKIRCFPFVVKALYIYK